MRWPVVLFFGYVVVGLELALRPALELGRTGIAPSFVLPFVVFVALFAPGVQAAWTAVALGLVLDLTAARGASAVIVPGPGALALAAAVWLVLSMRGATIRGNPVTLIVMSVLGSLAAGFTGVVIFGIRAIYDHSAPFHAGNAAVAALGSSVYTGVAAAVMTLALFPLFGLFGFNDPQTRRFLH